MSREFGEYNGGYFHDRIRTCGEDCENEGRDPLTKLWGEFLTEFYGIAHAIASSEACDSGPDHTIMQTIQRMPALKAKLSKITEFVDPYRRVAEKAVRNAAGSQAGGA